MKKKERYYRELLPLLGEFEGSGQGGGITEYLVAHSELPGRRANLELAQAFAGAAGERAQEFPEMMWNFCIGMTAVSNDEAPIGSPLEFIPFCGAMALGSIGSTVPHFFEPALAALRSLADDPRWRMREAVCFGLQALLAGRSKECLAELESWAAGGSHLQQRAAVAAVADPGILMDTTVADHALNLHRIVLDQVPLMEDRKSESFRILRKALGYTLSVVICAIPDKGFDCLRGLAASNDRDVRWIVKENLKKNRLVGSFPEQVETVYQLLN